MIFFLVTSYIILNEGRSITVKEQIILTISGVFLLYCIVARLFGIGPGMFIAIPVFIIVSIVVWKIKWRVK